MNLDQLTADLRRDEGERLKPYRDIVGKLTIGVGRNLDDVGISETECLMLLKNDITRVGIELDEHIPWWRQLDGALQGVLANMCFNLGINGLLGFHRFLTLLQAGKRIDAAMELLHSKWADQVGVRAVRLATIVRGTGT